MDNLLTLQNISKSYPFGAAQIQVLHQMNLSISQGSITAVVGSSGSGKSTLLHIMAGIDLPDKGIILFHNEDINQYNDKKKSDFRLKHFGFIFQSYHLIPTLSIYDNVILPILAAKRKSDPREIEQILEQLGLADRMFHFPHQLSGGEQQRAAIARAMINRPEIIFADEPTGNLDRFNSRLVMDLLTECCHKNGQTLVFVTHDLALQRYANHVIHLEKEKSDDEAE